MDYDYFLSTYGFPGFGLALLSAAFFAGIAFFLAYINKKTGRDVPDWVVAIIGFGFLISCGVMLVIGFILPWGSPI